MVGFGLSNFGGEKMVGPDCFLPKPTIFQPPKIAEKIGRRIVNWIWWTSPLFVRKRKILRLHLIGVKIGMIEYRGEEIGKILGGRDVWFE